MLSEYLFSKASEKVTIKPNTTKFRPTGKRKLTIRKIPELSDSWSNLKPMDTVYSTMKRTIKAAIQKRIPDRKNALFNSILAGL